METNALRHLLATVCYRLTKAVEQAPPDFAHFAAGEGVRTPLQLLVHINQVLLFAQSMLPGYEKREVPPGNWEEETERFYREAEKLDALLAEGLPTEERIVERLLQGPLADSLAHVGQIAMLRRLSGNPLAGIGYAKADIQAGILRYRDK